MRGVISIALQFLLFLITFALGSFLLHPFHLQTTLAGDATHTRTFVWDGLVLLLILYLLVLLLEVAMKRLRTAAPGSTIAAVLATLAGLLMKFGFLVTDR